MFLSGIADTFDLFLTLSIELLNDVNRLFFRVSIGYHKSLGAEPGSVFLREAAVGYVNHPTRGHQASVPRDFNSALFEPQPVSLQTSDELST